MKKCFGIIVKERSSFLKFCVYVFSFLYFLFFVNFLLYVTFFFRYFFSFISCVLFISKSCILYPLGYIIFCLSKNPSKIQANSKQNAKQTSKQNRNRVANVADIILSYTLIGYKFAVSLFASVLLQLLLKQIRKQNPSKRISKSNDVVSQSTLHNSPTFLFCLAHGF